MVNTKINAERGKQMEEMNLDELDLDWENMTMDQVIRAAIIASAINNAHETMSNKEKTNE